MRKPLPVLAALLLWLTPTFADAGNYEVRPGAVWIEPIGTITGAVYGWGYLSLGFEVPGGSYWNWMFGLGGVFAGQPSSGAQGFLQLWFFTGPAFYLGGGYTRLTGFFLCPKLLASYASQVSGASTNVEGELHLGLDFGYRATLGPLYVAPVIGLSAGPCFGCDNVPASPPLHVLGNPLGLRGRVEVNLNLLRLGAAF